MGNSTVSKTTLNRGCDSLVPTSDFNFFYNKLMVFRHILARGDWVCWTLVKGEWMKVQSF